MRGILLLLPLVGVNVWHVLVICMARQKSDKLASISESASASPKLLRTHQIVHLLGALCFIAFALVSFDVLGAASALLIVAAVLDVLQAALLSAKTDHSSLNLHDRHQFFAWAMAAGYMLFCLLFARHAQVHIGWIVGYTALLLVISAWNYMQKFKHFWAAQMAFFILTSLMMGFAAYQTYPVNMHLAILPRDYLFLGAAVMVSALGYVFSRERFGSHCSISLHASARRSTTWIFGVGLLIATGLLGVYFTQWLIPQYDYPILMRAVLFLTCACSAILALIPHHKGRWQGMIHAATAYVMAGLLPFTLLLHAIHTRGTVGGEIAFAGAATEVLLILILYSVKGMYEKFYLLQSMFFISYLTCIGIIGYL